LIINPVTLRRCLNTQKKQKNGKSGSSFLLAHLSCVQHRAENWI